MENPNTPGYWDQTHHDDAGRLRIGEERLSLIEALLPDDVQVLDIGCGTGELGRWLAYKRPLKQDYTGVDFSDIAMLSAESARARQEFITTNAETLAGVPDDAYHVVVCMETLEHLSDDALALVNMRRVCKDGGLIVVTVPHGGRNRSPEHVREYGIMDCIRLAEPVGELVRLEPVGDGCNWESLLVVIQVTKEEQRVEAEQAEEQAETEQAGEESAEAEVRAKDGGQVVG